ncbi:hypothetical protein NDU88_006643 [Pleurodeles waltl]|uniref:Uncharacterized protein n=1 Tax=Pleurodeles waltl TaxID=8319 RepID=A0AAV7LVG6_PLEWA|nr:hypothetical protein NDU88_006643 [Pleurodeles waltl]
MRVCAGQSLATPSRPRLPSSLTHDSVSRLESRLPVGLGGGVNLAEMTSDWSDSKTNSASCAVLLQVRSR